MKLARSATALSLSVLAVVALHWWHPGAIIAQGDSAPQLDPGVWFHKALPAWNDYDNYFGQISGSFSFVPFMALWWVLDKLFGPGLGEIALIYVLLAASWLGAFSFARRCGVTVAAATVAAWIYTINPFTQTIVPSLNATQETFLALLPWLGFFVVTAARDPQRRPAMRAALTIFALLVFPVLGITPQLVFQLLVAAVLLAVFCAFFARDMRAFFVWAAVTAVPMIAVSLWWAVPDVLSFVGVVIPHPTSLAANAWTFARASLLNDLRGLFSWGWAFAEYFPGAAAYDANPLTYAAGFLAFAGGVTGLIVLRGRQLAAARYGMACLLVMTFIAKGSHAPLSGLSALLWKIPGVFFFDDPGGATILAFLLASVITAAAFDALRLRRLRLPVATAAVVVASLSGILLVTGTAFHGDVNAPDGFYSPSVYVRVPAYWSEAAGYLNHSGRSGGVLLLPPNLGEGYDVRYSWNYYGGDGLPQNLIARPLLALDAGLIKGGGYLKHRASQAVADRVRAALDARSPQTPSLLRAIGIRYVLYRNDFIKAQPWLSDAQIARVLHATPARFGALSLYDLGVPQTRSLVRRGGLAVLGQRYDWSWIGLEVGHGVRIAPRVAIDGWRDAWPIANAGRFVVFNAVVAFEIIGLFCALGVAAWFVWRARS
ncbi:MAG TPA: alpha-(1-_3)-arabinofuranosyltransferase family protein [Candidatus Dormibacteraeota bacterium]|nr:alpha-(1->3)-arabinofuranosyltransferase family protein [Candidatus Dormibacteraeota bacterium]